MIMIKSRDVLHSIPQKQSPSCWKKGLVLGSCVLHSAVLVLDIHQAVAGLGSFSCIKIIRHYNFFGKYIMSFIRQYSNTNIKTLLHFK